MQARARGQLANDLVARVLNVQPEGLACLNELRYQRITRFRSTWRVATAAPGMPPS
jgi:hypothetical protein